MDYRLLGRSGLKVSALSIGTATFGGDGLWGATDVADAQRQIDLCLDHGVNLIDTANVYGGSKSETIIGEALTDGRRDRLLIATKVRFRRGTGPNDEGLSRWHIIRECENSLKRMKTDVIDLYQVHQWDGSTPLEETVAALDSLITQGKVRYVGCSNYSGWQLMKALGIADAHHQQRFVSQQIHYTLQAREAEYELIPLGLDQGVSLLVWSPLAGGWLTGKYTRSSRPDSGRQVTGSTSRRSETGSSCGRSSTCSTTLPGRMASRARRCRSPGCCNARPSPRSSSAGGPRRSSRTTSRRWI